MPAHDWTRVEAGIFHDFHNAWLTELRNALNDGLLPRSYYALAEQHAGRFVADLLTLHAAPPLPELSPSSPETGGLALAEAPPRVRRRETLAWPYGTLRRTLAIRHVSGHRLVAVLEIVSSANKDRAESVEEFAAKIAAFLEAGIHVLLVDLLPPGPHDPLGMHGAVRQRFYDLEPFDLPVGEPLTLASYEAGAASEAYVEHVAPGLPLPEMPLFFRRGRYINVPLEATYLGAYRGVPAFWRDVLERPAPSDMPSGG